MESKKELEEAAARVASGDEGAFRFIVEQTSDSLIRLGARMLSSVEGAEDVVQEGYVRAYRALVDGKFDGRSSVRTWLYRIVTNLAIDELRRSPRREKRVTDVELERATTDRGSAEARVALLEIEELLRELPPDQRAALTLSALEGLTNAEIAQVMSCSEGAVEQRLVRARVTLRAREKVS
jgi:RNA polymerase sigma-70 factor (ECF subfamily)